MRTLLAAALTLVALAACSGPAKQNAAAPAGRIALLLPELKASRYEAADVPYFSQRLKDLCPGCAVDYRNADQDPTKQASQATEALDQGAKVLVLDPVDSAAAGTIVTAAKARNVPVISYDRLILRVPVDYYVSFDNAKVGSLQAQDADTRALQRIITGDQ